MSPEVQNHPDSGEDISLLLKTLWAKNLPALRARLDLLDQAAVAAHTAFIPETLRKEAAGTAHKLAGSLGMFGYPEGTRVARELEIALTPDVSGFDPARLSRLAGELRTAVGIERA